eukprot:2631725-Prymnesium_polylepis.1
MPSSSDMQFADGGRALTEQERTSLTAIAPRIADAVATAGCARDVKLLGVALCDECAGTVSEAAQVVLLKFLRRNDYDVEAAVTQLTARLEWQRTFDVEAAKRESFTEDFAGCDTILGEDVEGRALVISVFGRIFAAIRTAILVRVTDRPVSESPARTDLDVEKVFGDPQRFLRWRVQMMEAALERMQPWRLGAPETLLQLHDYADCAILNKDPRITEAVKTFSHAMWQYYPETKGRTVFINFPAIFGVLFGALKLVLPSRTLSKFVMLGPVSPRDGSARELLGFIPPHWLPERYGGLLSDSAAARAAAGDTDAVLPAEVITLPAGKVVTREVALQPGKVAVRCVLRVLCKDVGFSVAVSGGTLAGGELPDKLYDEQSV